MWSHLLKLAALAAWPCLAQAAPFAYVPNEGSGTLSVIDTASDGVVVPTSLRGSTDTSPCRPAWPGDRPRFREPRPIPAQSRG